jgi:ribonuclease VapC
VSGVVIDSSAALAILLSEPLGPAAITALDAADRRLLSAATLAELSIVLHARLGPEAGAVADRFVRDGGIDVVPLDHTQADRAIEGWRRFGKGRHAAALNLGDCFTYGLAIATGEPVLCVGGDFPLTDARVVALLG